MTSTPSGQHRSQIRTYDRVSSVVFFKTKNTFGGLSNMASGFPLLVNGVRVRTSEALYQACRFPHLPDVQRLIIEQVSPMTAKMKSKRYRHDSRPDWNRVRVNVMRWCLRVKLAQNWDIFSKLLLETGNYPIVEQSRRDDYWGARPLDERTLVGMNVLGRLLMELRKFVITGARHNLLRVEPLSIPNFLLSGRPVEPVTVRKFEQAKNIDGPTVSLQRNQLPQPRGTQLSLRWVPEEGAVPLGQGSAQDELDQRSNLVKHFPSYKDSGVIWLGDVPAHWMVTRLKNVARLVMGQSPPSRHCSPEPIGLPFLQGCAEFGPDHPTPKQFCREPAKISPRAAILMSVRAPVGRINSADQQYAIGRGLCAIIPDSRVLNTNFAYFGLGAATKGLDLLSTGSTYGAVSASDVGTLAVLVPPLCEQPAIGRFIRHVDQRIRRYIRAKQKLIALLEEQKQAIIHRAVTGQIDLRTGRPYPTYKDSDVEWLGDVPAHWEVRRNGRLFVQRNETGFPELPVLEVSLNTGIRIRDFGNSDRKQMMAVRSEYKRAVKGDIAYNMMRMWQGAVGVIPVDGLVSPAYIVAKPVKGTESRYFSTLFRTNMYMAEVDKYSHGIVRDRNRLYWEDFKQIPTLFPPPCEQSSIIQFLDKTTDNIGAATDHARRQIELLQEFRTRLITDVVTGKLDVRGAATCLPSEAGN